MKTQTRRRTGKATSSSVEAIVREIEESIPRNTRSLSWWERVPEEHQEMLDGIHAGWHAGRFGHAKRPAARIIAGILERHGITIGEQGVTTWLKLPRKR